MRSATDPPARSAEAQHETGYESRSMMNCHEAMPLLPAYSDGELDPVQSAAIEQHVFGCADCTVRRDELASLRSRIRSEVPYYTAPPALHARVKAALARATDAPPPERPARDRWHWLTAGALGRSGAAGFAWFVGRAGLAREVCADRLAGTGATPARGA